MSQNRYMTWLVGGGVVISLLLIYAFYVSFFSVTLTTDIAPASGTITLDRKTIEPGKHRVRAGKHQLVFSRQGFGTITRDIDLARGTTQFIGAALVANDPEYADWYSTHPDDQKKAESISSQGFDSLGELQLKSLPLLKNLPYISLEPYFKIDYGPSKKYPNDPSKIALYIYANSISARAAAAAWLKDNGAKSSSLEIIYPYSTD